MNNNFNNENMNNTTFPNVQRQNNQIQNQTNQCIPYSNHDGMIQQHTTNMQNSSIPKPTNAAKYEDDYLDYDNPDFDYEDFDNDYYPSQDSNYDDFDNDYPNQDSDYEDFDNNYPNQYSNYENFDNDDYEDYDNEDYRDEYLDNETSNYKGSYSLNSDNNTNYENYNRNNTNIVRNSNINRNNTNIVGNSNRNYKNNGNKDILSKYSNTKQESTYSDPGWIKSHPLAFVTILILSLILVSSLTISVLYLTDNFQQIKGTPVAKTLDKISEKFGSLTNIEDDDIPVSSEIIDNVKIAPVDDDNDPEQKQHVDSISSDAGVNVTASDIKKNVQPYETSGVTIGIDVSKWQGTINWQSVAETGIDYAIIRVGYRTSSTGEIFEDPFARYNIQEAQTAGIKIGAYFFSTAKTEQEAVQEAAWTCKIISQYKITYPVVFDYECYDKSDSRNYNIDSSTKTKIATRFLKYVEKQGYTGMFYSSKSGLEKDFDTDSINSKYKIWIAQYPKTAYPQTSAPDYSGSYDMWQYTANGNVNGITGYADINVAKFGFSKESSAKNSTAPKKVTLDPEIGISFTNMDEKVTPKIEVNLREKPSSLEESKIIATIKNGETVQRTGQGSNGWSRLTYKNKTVYAVTSFLTADLNDTSQVDVMANQADSEGFTKVNEQVTAKDTVNLRTESGSSSPDTIVTSLKHGTYVKRIGIGSNGWSQLEYNGKTVYAISSYLEVKK